MSVLIHSHCLDRPILLCNGIMTKSRKGCSGCPCAGLADLLRNHTYVGMADDTLALVQHQTKLYLVDAYQLSHDLFFQQVRH